MNEKRSLAIIDMNNGVPNQGLRCIREIAMEFDDVLETQVYDARVKHEIPGLAYDIYIASGGPGSPLEEGDWKENFFELISNIKHHNSQNEFSKKYVFFICYSFQLACDFFQLGTIAPRKSTSFGVYPVHKSRQGQTDRLLENLNDPFYAVDSRDWQLIQPNLKVFEEHGARILSLEKIRTHVELERAIMAVRFNDEMAGTQFHPEADPEGMKAHFSDKTNRDKVIANFGEKKYEEMMASIDDPTKIALTHSTIIPGFIHHALQSIRQESLINSEL